jgi:NAD-dependent deacetylase
MVDFSGYKRIVVLTGAGISKSAGLPTYRGPGGLWTDENLAALSDAAALTTHRREVTDMFWKFRRAIVKVQPTAAHRALAAFEDKLPAGAELTIITQNVDGLHQAAGSRRVCEYHGSLARWRCEVCKGELEPPDQEATPVHCGEAMRPSVVLFGEMIPVDAERTAKHALRDCDLFVAIGTSGTVQPASSFVRWAEYSNAQRVLLNLEVFDGARSEFTYCYEGTADALVPQFFR